MFDDEGFEIVSPHRWYACRQPNAIYATAKIDGKLEYMHRLVIGFLDGDVDHRDSTDTLNNCKYNLRVASRSQNLANKGKTTKPTSSRYKGVSWAKHRQKWHAYVARDGKRINLGLFKEEFDAAQAYNFEAEESFGEFARLNEAG